MKQRCIWAKAYPEFENYHDKEWGVPLYDDDRLFEFLILEGMQAGLSWITILKKRDAFRAAFSNFDANKIAKYDARKINLLLKNAAIIRNPLKINAAINNAKAYLKIKNKTGSFAQFIWQFVDGQPMQNRWQNAKQVPANTETSELMSKELKKCGFTFVGSTICYAFMQAVGMVNDHIVDCFRHDEVRKSRKGAVFYRLNIKQ